MNYIAIDTETFLFSDTCQIPKLIVATFAFRDYMYEKIFTRIEKSEQALKSLKCYLLDDNYTIICHNAAFDMSVFAIEYGDEISKLIQAKYEKGLIICTYLNEKFIRIGTDGLTQSPEFSLAFCCKKYLDIFVDKSKDTYRTRYSELFSRDLADWPQDAIDYAVNDAVYTLQVFEKQGLANKTDIFHQCHTDWLCKMITNFGIKIDQDFLEERYAPLQENIDKHEYTLRKVGFKKAKPSKGYFDWLKTLGKYDTTELKGKIAEKCDYLEEYINAQGIDVAKSSLSTEFEYTQNKKNVKIAIEKICKTLDIPIMYTAGGGTDEKPKDPQISTKSEFLQELEGHDEGIDALLELGNSVMVKGTFLDAWRGKELIHCNLDVAAVTGRIICSKPNLTNVPRKGRIRGCFVPINPETHYLCSIDWSQVELMTLAQILYSTGCGSEMIDAINADMDLHCLTGATMLGIPYDRFVKLHKEKDKDVGEQRALAKVTNFGGGGGMGAKTLMLTAKKQGVKIDGKWITEGQAKDALTDLKRTFPLQRYFNNRKSEIVHTDRGAYYRCEQYGTDRVRMISAVDWKGDNAGYCAANNTYFQGLASDILKLSIRRMCKQIWFEKNPILNGVQPYLFVHDEAIIGVPKVTAHESAYAVSAIMIQAVKDMLPDIKVVKAEPALMLRWEKKAEAVFDTKGKLIPWEHEIHGKVK